MISRYYYKKSYFYQNQILPFMRDNSCSFQNQYRELIYLQFLRIRIR